MSIWQKIWFRPAVCFVGQNTQQAGLPVKMYGPYDMVTLTCGNWKLCGSLDEYQGNMSDPSTEECDRPSECPNSWAATANRFVGGWLSELGKKYAVIGGLFSYQFHPKVTLNKFDQATCRGVLLCILNILKILNLYFILSCTHLYHVFPVSIH